MCAGSAGCPVAAKLAQAGHSVLLIEVGPDDDWKGHDVAGNPADPLIVNEVPNLEYTAEIDDAVMSEPIWATDRYRDPRLANLTDLSAPLSGRREFMPRAKIVGGCSMHNWMTFLRPSPGIFESWGPDWDWDTLYPKFKAIETDVEERPDREYHGSSGECFVSTPPLYPADEAFIQAMTEVADLPRTYDFNGRTRVGVGAWPKSTRDGKRWGAGQAFLTAEVRALPHFRLLTKAMVTRVLFNGTRAVGVEYEMLEVPGYADLTLPAVLTINVLISDHSSSSLDLERFNPCVCRHQECAAGANDRLRP